MKKIAYYISDHGFGHATRSIALIRELAKNDNLQIFIKTGKPLSFMKESLTGFSNLNFIYSENDIGLVLEKDSLKVNKIKLQKDINNWVSSWGTLINDEILFLKDNKIDLVISDITPWPLVASKEVGVKSIAISNFAWYEIYQDLLESNIDIEQIGKAYLNADFFLQFPLNLELKKVNKVKDIGFISRKIDNTEVDKIRNKIVQKKKLIYVGIGKSVDFDFLKNIPFVEYSDHNWLFSAGVYIEGDNIYTIPEKVLETQNYIAACDYAITKAGWSTVAEAILGKVPLLLIERDEIIEDRTIINKVKELNLGLTITEGELLDLNIHNKLNKLDMLRESFNEYENETNQVAKQIYDIIKEGNLN